MKIFLLQAQHQTLIKAFCTHLLNANVWQAKDWLSNITLPYAAYACTEDHVNLTGFNPIQGMIAWYQPEGVDFAELLMVQVAPHVARQGIAQALWAHTRPVGKTIYLEVRASNHAAKALYQKLGFIESGCRKAYYHHPIEDACLMMLEQR